MQTVIDGTLINYTSFGSHNHQEILILHGWGQNSKDWEYIAQKLSVRYSVTTLDLPGFGGSSNPPYAFNSLDYSEVVKEFVKKLGLKNLIIIGHSFGGKIAIMLAAENKLNINKLFLISPSGIENKSIFTNTKSLIVKFLLKFFFWVPDKLRFKFSRLFASRDYLNSGQLKGTIRNIINENVVNFAKKIFIPTIIIWGENDEEVPLTTAKYLKYLIKGSVLRILWGERHSVNIENPDKLYSLLSEYL